MLDDKQVEVCFKIGKHEDVVLCDVVPMEASHLLLGRPWQFDRKTSHDGFLNKYSFVHHGKKIILAPLSPSEVREDQKKLREKYEQERKEEKTEDKRESEKGIHVDKNEGFINKENEGGKHKKTGREKKGKSFLHNSVPLYASLNLRTNPFKERENDEIKSSLSTWKETYKKMNIYYYF